MRRALALLSLGLSSASAYHAAGVRPAAPRRSSAPLLAEGDGGGFRLPFGNPAVPKDQQPAVELTNLRQEPFYDWADGEDDGAYKGKLGLLYAGIFAVVSLPISHVTYSWNDPSQLLLTSFIGTSGAMVPFVVRLRTGWGYVSKRLRQRVSYFEDKDERGASVSGKIATKDRATLMRDRLVEKEEVCPERERES